RGRRRGQIRGASLVPLRMPPTRQDQGVFMPPRVGIVLGSTSDEEKAKTAAVMLEKFGVEYGMGGLSAHRDPRRVAEYGSTAVDRGLQVLIAAAGKAAALPGALAAHTHPPTTR